jgi:hypothetical protein
MPQCDCKKMRKNVRSLFLVNKKTIVLFVSLLSSMSIALSIFSFIYHPEIISISWSRLSASELTNNRQIMLCTARSNGGYYVITPTVHKAGTPSVFGICKNLSLVQKNEISTNCLFVSRVENHFLFSFETDNQIYFISAGNTSNEPESKIFTSLISYPWFLEPITSINDEFLLKDQRGRYLSFSSDTEEWMVKEETSEVGPTPISFFGWSEKD